jgi:hypothetical protein
MHSSPSAARVWGKGGGGRQRMSTSRIKADPPFHRKLLAYLFRFVLTSKFRSSQSYFQNIQNVYNYFITLGFCTYFITISLRSRTAVSSMSHFWEIQLGLFTLMFFLWHRILETVRMANVAYTRISVKFQLHISVIDLFTVSRDWWRVFTFILNYDNKYTYKVTLRSVHILVSSTFLRWPRHLISCYHILFVHNSLDIVSIIIVITKAPYCIPLNNSLFILLGWIRLFLFIGHAYC